MMAALSNSAVLGCTRDSNLVFESTSRFKLHQVPELLKIEDTGLPADARLSLFDSCLDDRIALQSHGRLLLGDRSGVLRKARAWTGEGEQGGREGTYEPEYEGD